MKLNIRKNSLIIATVIFLFSGIFGLAEAAEKCKTFNTIKIDNKTKYDVGLNVSSTKYNSAQRAFELSIKAGESRKDSQKGTICCFEDEISIHSRAKDKYQKIFFDQNKHNKYLNRNDPTLIRIGVIEYGEHKGDFTIVVWMAGGVLYISIDSENPALKYVSESHNSL